jgi:hypothetical protein
MGYTNLPLKGSMKQMAKKIAWNISVVKFIEKLRFCTTRKERE